MPMNEIEEAMRARAGAVNKVRPRHRTLRGDAGAESTKSSGRAKLVQIGKQSLPHHTFRQPGIHSVDADDDHLLADASRSAAAAANPIAGSAKSGGRRGGDCRTLQKDSPADS